MIWMKVKCRFLLFYRNSLLKIGLKKALLKNRYGERILLFHGVDKVGNTSLSSRFFSEEYFERFIEYIALHYNIVSVGDYYAKNFKENTLNIAITFDDGYLNNYEYVIPILKKYKVPASFYITTIHEQASFLWTDFLDLVSLKTKVKQIFFEGNTYEKNKKSEFVNKGMSLKKKMKTISYEKIKSVYKLFNEDWNVIKSSSLKEYWQLMNFRQIKSISENSLFTIGSHAQTHANLLAISIKEAKGEIIESKKKLENILGIPIEEFAFPFGYYSDELANYCLEIGYKRVLLVDYNKNEANKNEVFKNRFVMNPYISFELQLICLLKGSYF